MIFEIETLPLIDAVTQPDFFLRPTGNAEKIRAFGQLWFRHRREALELLALALDRLEDKDFQSRNVRQFLLTHKTDGMTDQQVAASMKRDGMKVSKTSVETERQRLCDELAGYAEFETPAVKEWLRDGVKPPPVPAKLPRKRKK